jgi:hypothetical protein
MLDQARLRICAGQCGRGYQGAASVSGPSQHSKYSSLLSAGPRPVQRLLAGLVALVLRRRHLRAVASLCFVPRPCRDFSPGPNSGAILLLGSAKYVTDLAIGRDISSS